MSKPGIGPSRALDALNALVASSQTGFGAFIAVYLTSQAWTQTDIGVALSVGTIAAMVSQLPAGALVDRMRSKRLAVGAGGIAVALSALIFAILPDRAPVLAAELLHGFASCIMGPAIAALSFDLVGRAALGERLGRNARFAALGSAAAAALLGGVGTFVSSRAVFWATAGLMIGGLFTLRGLPNRPTRRDAVQGGSVLRGLWALLTPQLLLFALCLALFHLGNAAMLPLVAGELTRSAGRWANLVIAACIIAPQAIVVVVSPRVGREADRIGLRPVLLVGFAALPLRGVLLSVSANPALVVMAQALDGISAAVVGVAMPLMAAELSRGTGRFTLCMGMLGLAAGVGATLSTGLAGVIADQAGPAAALLALSAAGAAATAGLLALRQEPNMARSE